MQSPSAARQPADGLGPRAQRTVERIVEATREVFLSHGYSGTTIDEIARIADVSRASFYTYFSSKREVLLAVGAHAASESVRMTERFVPIGSTLAGMTEWVTDYFDFCDVHGSFAFAWTQAAQEDEEIRVAGMKRHLSICRQFGKVLERSAGRRSRDSTALGVTAFSTLERTWHYGQLYADTVERRVLIEQVARMLWSAARLDTSA